MSSGNNSEKPVCNGHRRIYYFVCIKLLLFSDPKEKSVHFQIKGFGLSVLKRFCCRQGGRKAEYGVLLQLEELKLRFSLTHIGEILCLNANNCMCEKLKEAGGSKKSVFAFIFSRFRKICERRLLASPYLSALGQLGSHWTDFHEI